MNFILSLLMSVYALSQACEVSQNPAENPKVFLTGERHFITGRTDQDPEAHEGVESLSDLIQSSLKGDIVLALEGPFYGDQASLEAFLKSYGVDLKGAQPPLISGIEDPEISLVTDYWSLIHSGGSDLHRYSVRAHTDWALILTNFSLLLGEVRKRDKLLELMNQDFPGLDPLISKSFSWNRSLLDGPTDESVMRALNPYRYQPGHLFSVLDAHVVVFQKYAEHLVHNKIPTVVPLPPSFLESVQAYYDGDPEPFLCKIVTGYRNQIFAKYLDELLCKAKSEDKDLYVRTGKMHSPGLKKILDSRWKSQVQVIAPEEDVSFEDDFVKSCLTMAENYDS